MEFLSLKGGCAGSSEVHACQNATLLEFMSHMLWMVHYTLEEFKNNILLLSLKADFHLVDAYLPPPAAILKSSPLAKVP